VLWAYRVSGASMNAKIPTGVNPVKRGETRRGELERQTEVHPLRRTIVNGQVRGHRLSSLVAIASQPQCGPTTERS
jgi:hypothetical protein